MSSEIAIRVEGISKCYQIYNQPRDRLKQFVLPRLQQVAGFQASRYYQEFWALKDISFEVKKGETVGIIGRNGSGKSTLLQIITGTLSPTLGTVFTHGRIAALLELGSGFNPEFTGRENVYLNGALLGLSKSQIDDRFDAIAAFADIGEHLEQAVKTYSSGMLVRLAFAVQVQIDPDILIVDEALAVGDALFQKRCFQRIEKLVSDGTTVLFVSHDQESVRTLTSRALLLSKGKSISWGLSSEVVLEYRRLLHNEEAKYFAEIAKAMTDQAKSALRSTAESTSPSPLSQVNAHEAPATVSDRLSFGDGEAKITNVEILDVDNKPRNVFYTREEINIRVTFKTFRAIDRLNVALRLRNKEGVKVYSWGTLNQDMAESKTQTDGLFWNEEFTDNQVSSVTFTFPAMLGTNLYEVQAAVSQELSADYTNQRILHWIDEAAFFQVTIPRETNFFGGLVDLNMKALW